MFSLTSIDASRLLGYKDYLDAFNSPQLIIRGLKSDNTQISTTFNLGSKSQTFLLPKIFNNLQSVTFSGVIGRKNSDDNLAVDNIVLSVASIPEPTSTASLLAIGTLGTLLTRKRVLKQKIKQLK